MKKIIFAATSILFFSCSSHEVLELDNIPPEGSKELTFYEKVSLLDNYELPENFVLDIARLFNDKFIYSDETRGEQEKPMFSIKEKMNVPVDFGAQSRGSVVENIPIFKIQLDCGNKHGYALVSGDMRSPKVLAYIPDTVMTAGYYDTNAANAAKMMRDIAITANMKRVCDFNAKKEALRQSATEKLLATGTRSRYDEDEIKNILKDIPNGVKVEQSEKTFPFMKTTWNQGIPYNCKLPQDCDSTPDGRYNAGCGVVAVAQAMAYYEPKLTLYGTTVDWKKLKVSPTISVFENKKIKDQVGYLMKWIGEKGNARYTCDGTYTGDIISSVLSLVGMKCDGKTSWNWNAIKSSIDNRHLVHATAINTEGKGHAWIIDGYLTALYPGETENDRIIYVHNNFGWGGLDDGYYELEPTVSFDANSSTFTPININPNISIK